VRGRRKRAPSCVRAWVIIEGSYTDRRGGKVARWLAGYLQRGLNGQCHARRTSAPTRPHAWRPSAPSNPPRDAASAKQPIRALQAIRSTCRVQRELTEPAHRNRMMKHRDDAAEPCTRSRRCGSFPNVLPAAHGSMARTVHAPKTSSQPRTPRVGSVWYCKFLLQKPARPFFSLTVVLCS